jgi:Asp-tRNA(Asn)/Glu-tRNA(Gln) amidotransferase C subunit
MNEKEREEIKKQAKEIMDKFAKSIDSVKDKVQDSSVERDKDRREEREGKSSDADFRKIMFSNAPSKEGDFILGEKKKWE